MNQLSRFILNIKLVKRIISKSKRLILPGFEGVPLYDVMTFFFKEVQKRQLNDRAASIAFFFLLAIPPTCIFLFTLLPFIPLENLENTLYILVHELTPNQNTYNIVHGVIHDFLHTQRTGLLSFAFLLAIISSSSAVLGILRSFNKNHPSFRKRSALQQRWMAIKLNCLLILLLITSVVLMVAQSSVFSNLLSSLHLTGGAVKVFIGLVRWLIIVMLFFTIISLIYTYGPAVKVRWKFITAGSTLATALLILFTLGFSFYVNNFSNFNRIYGSIGSIIVLMLWIYVNSFVLLIGFELNASIDMIRQEAESREEKEQQDGEEMEGLS
jgi:membrane protein